MGDIHLIQQIVWAVFGVILYNFLSFTIAKDKADAKLERFNFGNYAGLRWDNWVWSLLCVPLVVFYGDQLWYYLMEYYEKDWKFLDVLYLSAGFVAEGLYFLLKKLLNLISHIGGTKDN